MGLEGRGPALGLQRQHIQEALRPRRRMLWFQGAILATMALARGAHSIRGFVAGDEQSTQMAASWEDESSASVSDSFVVLKIDTQRGACVQFSPVCPGVCVPSSFFIADSELPWK